MILTDYGSKSKDCDQLVHLLRMQKKNMIKRFLFTIIISNIVVLTVKKFRYHHYQTANNIFLFYMKTYQYFLLLLDGRTMCGMV